jgi:hypothetical protein
MSSKASSSASLLSTSLGSQFSSVPSMADCASGKRNHPLRWLFRQFHSGCDAANATIHPQNPHGQIRQLPDVTYDAQPGYLWAMCVCFMGTSGPVLNSNSPAQKTSTVGCYYCRATHLGVRHLKNARGTHGHLLCGPSGPALVELYVSAHEALLP